MLALLSVHAVRSTCAYCLQQVSALLGTLSLQYCKTECPRCLMLRLVSELPDTNSVDQYQCWLFSAAVLRQVSLQFRVHQLLASVGLMPGSGDSSRAQLYAPTGREQLPPPI